MQGRNIKLTTSASFAAAAAILLNAFASAPSPAAEPNRPPDQIAVRMLHVFIQADVNDVRFENIWVFAREEARGPWQVDIQLKPNAELLHLDDPNETVFLPSPPTIRKTMAADSLVDSVGFSYLLPNSSGVCITEIAPPWRVDSMVVSVSAPSTRLLSNLLKPDAFRRERSGFSTVYSAANIPPGTSVSISLAGLPKIPSSLPRTLCALALALIFAGAAVTMYCGRRASKRGTEQR
ncbi:MAG: hypothetical protein JSU94_20535 [Phycisphaerales bacterium]|nr:MAG: hypothetical protein JSU94_20535 [Phycisphaerales bacterium]